MHFKISNASLGIYCTSSLTNHLLVDQMCDELGDRHCDGLIAATEGTFELYDQSPERVRINQVENALQDEVANLGELGVDDRHQACVHMREGRREGLCLDDRTC